MTSAAVRPATLEGLRRHNLRSVLRALYRQQASSRSELSLVTGLTKPTVSTLVADLIAEGLVSEQGLGRASGSGGKRPTLLRFEPGAREVIGVSVGEGQALGVLSDLGGTVHAMHVTAVRAGDVGTAVLEVIGGLQAQLDAPLASVGVGVPSTPGTGQLSVDELARAAGVPVHVAGRAELGALGQLAYGGGVDGTLVSLVVDDGVEIGVCLAGGTHHYGSDLSALASGLDWPTVERSILEAVPNTAPDARPGAVCLGLRAASLAGDARAETARRELAERLGAVLAWVVATLRPGQIALGGPLAELGAPFLDLLRSELAGRLPDWQLAGLDLTMVYTQQVSAMGAVALAVQGELELLFG